MDPSIRPSWERWLVIALVVAMIVGVVLALWLYAAVAG
jgi:capsular polysaccharide biosynthesis protein